METDEKIEMLRSPRKNPTPRKLNVKSEANEPVDEDTGSNIIVEHTIAQEEKTKGDETGRNAPDDVKSVQVHQLQFVDDAPSKRPRCDEDAALEPLRKKLKLEPIVISPEEPTLRSDSGSCVKTECNTRTDFNSGKSLDIGIEEVTNSINPMKTSIDQAITKSSTGSVVASNNSVVTNIYKSLDDVGDQRIQASNAVAVIDDDEFRESQKACDCLVNFVHHNGTLETLKDVGVVLVNIVKSPSADTDTLRTNSDQKKDALGKCSADAPSSLSKNIDPEHSDRRKTRSRSKRKKKNRRSRDDKGNKDSAESKDGSDTKSNEGGSRRRHRSSRKDSGSRSYDNHGSRDKSHRKKKDGSRGANKSESKSSSRKKPISDRCPEKLICTENSTGSNLKDEMMDNVDARESQVQPLVSVKREIGIEVTCTSSIGISLAAPLDLSITKSPGNIKHSYEPTIVSPILALPCNLSMANAVPVAQASMFQVFFVTPPDIRSAVEMVTPSKRPMSEMVATARRSPSEMITPVKRSLAEMVTPSKQSTSEMVTPAKRSTSRIVTPVKPSIFGFVTPSKLSTSGFVTPSKPSASVYVTPWKPSGSGFVTPSKQPMFGFVTPAKADIDSSIQLLNDQLLSLNRESSNIATHVYRRQTPNRKRFELTNQKRSLSTPRKYAQPSTTPSLCAKATLKSPSTTPRRKTVACLLAEKSALRLVPNRLETWKEELRSANSSQSTVMTPSKSKTKRKLYADLPERFTTTLDLGSMLNETETAAPYSW